MEKRSRVLIEPQQKVLETLQLAVRQVGLETFSKRVDVDEEHLNKMLVGEQWIPMYMVREACEINKYAGGPPYTRYVSSCIEGTLMRMEGVEFNEGAETAANVKEIKPKETKKVEKIALDKEKYAREEASVNRMLIISACLPVIIFVLAIMGYLIGKNYGQFYAGVGLFAGIIISLIVILLTIFKVMPKLFMAKSKQAEP
ncbi:MAG TPA: hypothetical protein VED00_00845 [archaeon]|nr:hypothetical protein [archaeon]